MRLSPLLFGLAKILFYPAVIITVLLYFYPLFTGCEFPRATKAQPHYTLNSSESDVPAKSFKAPFRLLAFGDPQLEGDSSLPDPDAPFFPSLFRLDHIRRDAPIEYNYQVLKATAQDFVKIDVVRVLATYRKKLDLLGNDFYLAHIYRTLHWWLEPTHVTVLGDLLGSQWISDGEFDRRADRFWNRVFQNGSRVEDRLAERYGGRTEELGSDPDWARRVITIPGNHDVGYAGDMTTARLDRFERSFGKTNWDITFTLPENKTAQDPSILHKVASAVSGGLEQPAIRLFAINSMNLDSPAYEPELQTATYDYINDAISRSPPIRTSKNVLNIVLTHIPLYKQGSICVDGPLFTYHEWGSIREQNHLSQSASAPIIEGILGKSANSLTPGHGLGRHGLVLAGHDHEGCDVWHYADPQTEDWSAVQYHSPAGRLQRQQRDVAGFREVTLRAMMGSYGGHAYMISAWFDADAGEWQYDVGTCQAGVQHIWWAVHVVDLILAICLAAGTASRLVEAVAEWRQAKRAQAARRGRSKSFSKSRSSTPGRHRSKSRAKTPLANGGVRRAKSRSETPADSVRRRKKVESDSAAR